MLVGGLFLILMLLGAPIAIALGVAGLTGMFEMGEHTLRLWLRVKSSTA